MACSVLEIIQWGSQNSGYENLEGIKNIDDLPEKSEPSMRLRDV